MPGEAAKIRGYVLTGGRSRRMGRDKAMLAYRGRTLVEHMAGAVESAAGAVSLVGGEERYLHLGLRCLGERYAGCGPMSGLEAALRDAGPVWALVVGCDMPGVSAGALTGLVEQAERSGADAVAAQAPGGGLEPLLAVYHGRILPVVEGLIERGEYRMQALLEAIETEAAAVAGECTVNVNTAEEWAKWSQ